MAIKRITAILCFMFMLSFSKAQVSDVKVWVEDIDYYKFYLEKLNQVVQSGVLIAHDWNSFSNGRDNMMEWVIKDIRNK